MTLEPVFPNADVSVYEFTIVTSNWHSNSRISEAIVKAISAAIGVEKADGHKAEATGWKVRRYTTMANFS